MSNRPHTEAEKAERDARSHLRDLIAAVEAHLAALDLEMGTPSTEGKGTRVAKLANALELRKDIAKRYGLGK